VNARRASMSSPRFTLLGSVFGIGVHSRNALYDRGVLRARCLRGPVISVGNLSVGGSGKTPLVLLLAELLKARGVQLDILSRGYGRQTSGVALVDPEGCARDFGDEPLLMARRLGVPVVIGEDRYEAGLFAEARFGPQFHLLDDGFQHRALARDFDVVLVTPDDARDRLLPRGRLREPVNSLRRADAVVLVSGASPDAFPLQGKFVWHARRGIWPKRIPPRPVAFCAIARPHNFFQQLRTSRIEPVAEVSYRDHHAYTENDVRELLELCRTGDGGGFVTTEKDAINLGSYLSALQPLAVVPVRMKLLDAPNVIDTLLRVVQERSAGREKILLAQ
jgi:tetraacyldisaccharide 4'-kinase